MSFGRTRALVLHSGRSDLHSGGSEAENRRSGSHVMRALTAPALSVEFQMLVSLLLQSAVSSFFQRVNLVGP